MTLLIRKTYTPCLAQSSSEVHLKSGVCTRIKNLETLFFCLEYKENHSGVRVPIAPDSQISGARNTQLHEILELENCQTGS